jgi:hypothetical protein
MQWNTAMYQKHCILYAKLSNAELRGYCKWLMWDTDYSGGRGAGILLNSRVWSVADLNTLICGLENLHLNPSRDNQGCCVFMEA